MREEFDQGNEFCKKVTYRVADDKKDAKGNVVRKGEDPKSVLAQFRNDYHPRIAVTVDMIATGTDVKPLECLLFMRDVKSRNYFEQMKGRGTRTLDADSLKKVTPSANSAKTHYVIVDAIGVTKSLKTASQPLITKPSVPLKDLAMGVMMGASDEDTVSSLAGRLSRLDKQLDEHDHKRISEKADGHSLKHIIGSLLSAINPDNVEQRACQIAGQPENTDPGEDARNKARAEMVGQASNVFNGELIDLIDSIRRDKEQTIDHTNLDSVTRAEWAGETEENAKILTREFSDYLNENRDDIEALEIYFSQPARRAQVTYQMIHDLFDRLRQDRPKLAPLRVWQAYEHLDKVRYSSNLADDPESPAGGSTQSSRHFNETPRRSREGGNPVSELTALVALIRRVTGLDNELTPYATTVQRNFKQWIFHHHSGAGEKFNDEQMNWLQMIRDHIISSFHIERDDLEMAPFDSKGGMGKMYQLFGDRMDEVIEELNQELVA